MKATYVPALVSLLLSVGLLTAGCAAETSPQVSPQESPTASSSRTTSPEKPRGIPGDFPLAQGWPGPGEDEGGPTDGLRGPARSLKAMELTACGAAVTLPVGVDHLSATWSNPEDYRARMLVSFGSVPAAREYAAAVTDLYRSCPSEDTQDGYTTVAEVVDLRLGEESSAVILHQELGGAPAIGLRVVEVVRVGTSVLVETGSTEGGEAEGGQLVELTSAGLTDVVAALSGL